MPNQKEVGVVNLYSFFKKRNRPNKDNPRPLIKPQNSRDAEITERTGAKEKIRRSTGSLSETVIAIAIEQTIVVRVKACGQTLAFTKRPRQGLTTQKKSLLPNPM